MCVDAELWKTRWSCDLPKNIIPISQTTATSILIAGLEVTDYLSGAV